MLHRARVLRDVSSKRLLSTIGNNETLFGGLPLNAFIKLAEDGTPFVSSVLGLKCKTVETKLLIMELPMKKEFIGRRDNRVLHGGVVAAAIDHVGGFAAWTAVGPNQMVSTVDLRIDYLAPAPFETLQVIGEIVSVKTRLMRADIKVQTASGSVVAIGRGLYNIYQGPPGFDMRKAWMDTKE